MSFEGSFGGSDGAGEGDPEAAAKALSTQVRSFVLMGCRQEGQQT